LLEKCAKNTKKPLTRVSKGLIGKDELAWMKPDAILVNAARDAILDEGCSTPM
jgi:lactate dehydrogenase-like 2-hydroxyacid dehydrogenase